MISQLRTDLAVLIVMVLMAFAHPGDLIADLLGLP